MKRLRLKDKNFRRIIIVIILIILIFVYFELINNTTFYKYILDDINSKYETNYNFNNKVIFNTLNKIVNINSLEHKESKEVFKVEKTIEKKEEVKPKKPIIYIYNTHDTESYSLPFVSDYSVTPDVKLASYILKDYLNDFGIESTVEKKSIKKYLNKYNLNYSGCYSASRAYIKEEQKNYDYKILIDLHRDSAKHKYTLYEKNNKKYAKVMFVLTTKHKDYKKNESFVNNINKRINKKYKGLSRGILKRDDVIFNQDLSERAILIELGGVDNTLEEINNTLYVLAKVLSEYIKEEL